MRECVKNGQSFIHSCINKPNIIILTTSCLLIKCDHNNEKIEEVSVRKKIINNGRIQYKFRQKQKKEKKYLKK